MAWLFFLEHYVWLSCGYCNVICKIDTKIENELNDLFRNILSSLMFHQHRHLQLRRRNKYYSAKFFKNYLDFEYFQNDNIQQNCPA